MRRKKVLAFALSLAMVLSLVPASAMAASGPYSMNLEDYNGKWAYNETYDCYELLNVVYCKNPENIKYEALNIYVPTEYVKSFENGKIVFDETKELNGYTADTAPIIYANGASGWAARETTKSTLEKFGRALELNWYNCLDNGYVIVGIGSRGSASTNDAGEFDGKIPNNIVDAKAGVRFLKYNDEYLPGSSERIVSVGASGGGGMSAIVGASGNSTDYNSYLEDIGAIMTEDDAIFADMCYCPITDLDNADMGYSWFYQNQLEISSRGKTNPMTEFAKALNADLAEAYEDYVVGLNLDASYAADFDNYAMDVAAMFEASYEKYLEDNFGTDKEAAKADAANYDWLTYDETTGKVTINGDTGREKLDNVVSNHNSRGKDCPGFDIFDNTKDSRAECNLFGTNFTNDSAGHFSKSFADVLIGNNDKYVGLADYVDYRNDYAEAYTTEMQQRAKMANPMYYIQEYAAGTSEVQPAEHFRLLVGSSDSNTTPTVVYNLGKIIENAGIDVEYGYVWNMGHGTRDYDDINDEIPENEPLIEANHGLKAQYAFVDWVEEICDEADDTTTPDEDTTTPGDDTQQPSGDAQQGGTTGGTTGGSTSTSPKTGDVNPLPMLAVVLAAGAVAIASARKREIC